MGSQATSLDEEYLLPSDRSRHEYPGGSFPSSIDLLGRRGGESGRSSDEFRTLLQQDRGFRSSCACLRISQGPLETDGRNLQETWHAGRATCDLQIVRWQTAWKHPSHQYCSSWQPRGCKAEDFYTRWWDSVLSRGLSGTRLPDRRSVAHSPCRQRRWTRSNCDHSPADRHQQCRWRASIPRALVRRGSPFSKHRWSTCDRRQAVKTKWRPSRT